MTKQLMAEVEMDLLKDAAEYAPVAEVKATFRGTTSVRYIFQDSSRLYIYMSGAASCERAQADVISYKEAWHACNTPEVCK